MTTIPASQLVSVLPNVLSAGGNALDLTGLVLTQNTRVPTGQVLSFPNDGTSVSDYFGPSAEEVGIADVYFNGFDNSTRKPEAIFFARFTSAAATAFVRGGPVNVLTIPQLKGLSGSLSVVMDGLTYSAASIVLAAATSYSSAAAIIKTAINATLPSAASFTAAIAPGTASVTAGISGNVMNVTAVGSGTLVVGAILTGTGVTAGTQIQAQLSGVAGGVGTYAVSIAQAVVDGTTISASYGTMTVSAVASGTLSVGQAVSGGTTVANTQITALGTGTGLTGTYIVNLTQTVASTSLTSTGYALDVTYDSVSGGFVITSGSWGAGSTVAYPTGTLAPEIFMTEATGAVLSQGAAATTPATFMDSLTNLTQNWATFMTVTDPDAGNGCEQKILFSQWVNTTNNRYAYVAMDTDAAPRASNNATASFGNRLLAADYDGTCAISAVDFSQRYDAFICGSAASINFEALNGRITFAYKGQTGLIADVTTATDASNLIANGYNFYGAYATANDQFRLFQKGTVSGRFQWLDSYVNQIWLNNAMQLALMNLLANTNSVPYNNAGYSLIYQSLADPINAGVNFGAIRVGVTLSTQQIAQIRNATGVDATRPLFDQGWYLQIVDASAQVRQDRESPNILFYFCDGGSVQKIVLNSVLVQ